MIDVVFYIVEVIYKIVYCNYFYSEYFIIFFEKVFIYELNVLGYLFVGICYMFLGLFLIVYILLILDIKVVLISIFSKIKLFVFLYFLFYIIKVYIG